MMSMPTTEGYIQDLERRVDVLEKRRDELKAENERLSAEIRQLESDLYHAVENRKITEDENEAKDKRIAELEKILDEVSVECINLHCDNRGAVQVGEDDWDQCEFCYTTPNSKFNINEKLKSIAKSTQDTE